MFRFQVLSDVHSEMKPTNLQSFQPKADHLFLAGDIGRAIGQPKDEFRKLFSHFNQNWKSVYYVPGNHEFYKQRYTDALKTLKDELAVFPNIHFLHREVLKPCTVSKIRILGCTLWSWIPEINISEVETYINDYHLIRDDEYRKINSRFTSTLHLEDVDFLKKHLDDVCSGDFKTIVLTHHASYIQGTSDPKYVGKKTNTAFATNLESLFKNVDVWISGHTHWNYDFTVSSGPGSSGKSTRLISNQYGYSMAERARFNFERVYEI